MMQKMNKKGWIRIVEAAVSILIITGVLLVVINKGYIGKKDISERVYDAQISVLREIEKDENLRDIILEVNNSELPTEWDEFTGSLATIKTRINQRMLEQASYLECEAKLCELDKICVLEKYIEKDVYAQATIISANLEHYQPKQIKMFCWEK